MTAIDPDRIAVIREEVAALERMTQRLREAVDSLNARTAKISSKAQYDEINRIEELEASAQLEAEWRPHTRRIEEVDY
jgi:hypothetical protein